VLLGSAEIGWQFYMKREMQNAADLAALTAVQVLTDRPDAARCSQAQRSAVTGAIAHMPDASGALEDSDVSVNCVRWQAENVRENSSGVITNGPVAETNAVQVNIAKAYAPLIPRIFSSDDANIGATAIATLRGRAATFTIGAQLLGTNSNAPLMKLLSALGLPASVTALDYNGVANLKVTPAGLLHELVPALDVNAATPQALAQVSATASQILEASVRVLRKSDPNAATANISALANAIAAKAGVGQVQIPIFSSQTSPGLFGLVTTQSKDAALHAGVSALALISASVETATSKYAVAIHDVTVGPLSIQAGIVEPPSVGVGGIGTKAYNAQVRVFLEIDTNRIQLLAPILNLLGARVYLPVTIDLVRAQGEITDIDCTATPRRVEIAVQSSALKMCFVDPAYDPVTGAFNAANRFSRVNTCGDVASRTQPAAKGTIRLLGIDLLPRGLKALEVLAQRPNVTFNVPLDPVYPYINADAGNAGALGTSLSNALATIFDGLARPSLAVPSQQENLYRDLAGRYLEATKTGSTYDVAKVIPVLRNGSAALGLAALNDWTVAGGVPYKCGLLGLGTCYRDGSVWDSFESSTTGKGRGALDFLVGKLLGNLLVSDCHSLLGAVGGYNTCVKNNLASFLRSNPNDQTPITSEYYCGPLCTLLTPVAELLRPTLNTLGNTVVQGLLNDTLGLRVGQTEVRLYDLQCGQARLVY